MTRFHSGDTHIAMDREASAPPVLFLEPPLAQQTGGLQAALESLRAALIRLGVPVEIATELPALPAAGTVVHFHGLWQTAHSSAAADCRAADVPYLVSPHGMLEPWAWRHKIWKKLPYFLLVERRFLSGAHSLLATSVGEAQNLARFFPRARIDTIPLGLTGDARPEYSAARADLGWKSDEWILLFLSRVHKKKGLELLLDALVDLKDERPGRIRLVVVGGGEAGYVEGLKRDCENRRADLPPIEWKGEIWGAEKWRYFQGADLFCLPTYSENFGLAVLESCQVGTPVLTTTTTPWGTYLAEGRGFIAEPKSAAVAATLREAFRAGKWDETRRQSLADWAIGEFSWERIANEYAALYRSTIAE